jgi:hypothetical protein
MSILFMSMSFKVVNYLSFIYLFFKNFVHCCWMDLNLCGCLCANNDLRILVTKLDALFIMFGCDFGA